MAVEQIPLRVLRRAVLFQSHQLFLRIADHAVRHARQCGDLQAVALAGGAFVDGVQEDDAVLVLDGGEVDVGELLEFFGQPREFEVVRGEQGVAAVEFQ